MRKRERELTAEEKTDTADVLVQRTNALWDAEDQLAALRSDLAAAREREGRWRVALESIANGDYWAPQIAAEALAEPADDAGRMPVDNKSRELAALVLGFNSAAEVDALREREGG